MKDDMKKKNVSKFTKMLSQSSQNFLASFLDDSIKENKEREALKQKVNLAISQKSFVVLQIKNDLESNDSLETIAGTILRKQKSDDCFILKLQKTNQLRMVNMEQIRKISFMQKKETKNTIAE